MTAEPAAQPAGRPIYLDGGPMDGKTLHWSGGPVFEVAETALITPSLQGPVWKDPRRGRYAEDRANPGTFKWQGWEGARWPASTGAVGQ